MLARTACGTMLAVVLMALPASSQDTRRWTSDDGLTVVGNRSGFEVLSGAGSGKADYFCAAGTFAALRLGAAHTDRVVVVRGLGPSATQPTRFSVIYDILGPGKSSTTVQMLAGPRQGQVTSVGHARALCRVQDGGAEVTTE